MSELFGKGGIPKPVDERDYQWEEVGRALPPFDWSTGYDVETELGITIPVKNQNSSSSCGGQAGSYYAGVLEAINDKGYEERSAKFIYSQIFVPGGGAWSNSIAKLLISQGCCMETLCSSLENNNPPSESFMEKVGDITSEARDDARKAEELAYLYTALDIDSVAQAIQNNHGAILLVRGANNGTWLSEFPQSKTPGEWGHFLYAGKAKTVSGQKMIGVLNSWGETAGNKGWQWLSNEWFTSGNIIECMTLTYNPNPVLITLHHVFNLDMSMGDRNPEVTILQQGLQMLGFFPKTIPCTGYFGTITKNAVKAFQKAEAIEPQSGFCGPLTRTVLNKIFL